MADSIFDVALGRRFNESPVLALENVNGVDSVLIHNVADGLVYRIPASTLASFVNASLALGDILTALSAPNGVATLDSGGKVPAAQLPAYVDDVLEYATASAFPVAGEAEKIYVALDTNLTYRWSGSAYVEISKSLALGETSSTAYRGDRGKTAYDHSQATGNAHGLTRGDLGATTVGGNLFTLPNPSAVRFLRLNADNSVSSLTAADFLTAIGAAPTAVVPDRIADDAGCLRVSNPGGAAANLYNGALTGAIKIALPTAAYNSNSMVSFTVDIYNYSTGTSRRIRCGGYNYSTGTWVSVFATQETAEGGEITVRFGHDGTRNCVWIGETGSVWTWANVGVTDFQAGFQNFTEALWGAGWAVSTVTSFDTVQATVRTGGTVRRVAVPTSATASGRPGEVAMDSSYLYVCTANDTWRRTALSTW